MGKDGAAVAEFFVRDFVLEIGGTSFRCVICGVGLDWRYQGRPGNLWLTGKKRFGRLGEEKANMLLPATMALFHSIAYGCRVLTC